MQGRQQEKNKDTKSYKKQEYIRSSNKKRKVPRVTRKIARVTREKSTKSCKKNKGIKSYKKRKVPRVTRKVLTVIREKKRYQELKEAGRYQEFQENKGTKGYEENNNSYKRKRKVPRVTRNRKKQVLRVARKIPRVTREKERYRELQEKERY